MLKAALRQLFSQARERVDSERVGAESTPGRQRVLNVGGNSKNIPIPAYFDGWEHVLLDIDPTGNPDIVCDARKLSTLRPAQFDAVYCSHNLEHYHKHEGIVVLQGFLHVLKADGFAEIRVPDLESVMKAVVERDLDVEDTLYVSPVGSMTVRDVIYGWSVEIERSGVDFFAHKTGFTATSLRSVLLRAGFLTVLPFVARESFELRALAFKASEPTHGQKVLLELEG
ncbi:MAG TPA: class I SAM-dependent methyltransferase [Casimicrobiaceae bacterium]|nr:class I SAM-dependent methyltransferase [Casimicrobiaceae bacterium]